MVRAPGAKATQGKPLRILVADDDRDAVVTLSTVLQAEGYQVIEVYGGGAVIGSCAGIRPTLSCSISECRT